MVGPARGRADPTERVIRLGDLSRTDFGVLDLRPDEQQPRRLARRSRKCQHARKAPCTALEGGMTTAYRRIPGGSIRIALPNVIQERRHACGAAALMAVAGYFGVGPKHEEDFLQALRRRGMDPRVGAHPDQIVRAARRFGLETRELAPMSLAQLRAALRARHPVMLMLQAWGAPAAGRASRKYRDVWTEGHWVVAIGFDPLGVFFEDPSLGAVRGYLTNEELDDRWHDTGRRGRHIDRCGIVIWRPGRNVDLYLTRARHID
jgi:predicted double-glycine peptidase